MKSESELNKKRPGIIVIVQDWGRMNQKSFSLSEIWIGINRDLYQESRWVEVHSSERQKQIEDKAKIIGWDIKHVQLFP